MNALNSDPNRVNDYPRRALLRYFGGKWALAPWIMAHFPAHRIYVEPFGGAASVLLRKPRSRVEVYNDLDEEIVGIFRLVQSEKTCQALMRCLRRTPYSRQEFERAFESSTDPIIRTQRAIIRAYQSFHHQSLFNRRNSTFAAIRHISGGHCRAREWASYPRCLGHICQRLKGVIIECRAASEVICAQDSPDTLFFVDPPYLPSTRSKYVYRYEMSEVEHIALLEQLRSVQGNVVLAGYSSDLYQKMLPDWQCVQRPFRAAGSTRSRTEMLWLSPNISV